MSRFPDALRWHGAIHPVAPGAGDRQVAGARPCGTPLVMLTGDYDYSGTTELSAATAAKIPVVRFPVMAGMGHFPFAENPQLPQAGR